MPSKKDIKTRIRAVQNTQKVTKSMKLISIIKLKQVQNAINSARAYNDQLSNLIQKTLPNIDFISLDKSELPVLARPNAAKNSVCLIVISSDRGLCGPYNSQLFKFLHAKVEAYKAEGKTVSLILFGIKAISYAQKHLKNCEIIKKYGQLPVFIPTEIISEVTQTLEEQFLESSFSSVELIYSHFISMIKSNPSLIKLAPFTSGAESNHQELKQKEEILFEPGSLEVLKYLIPLYLKNQLNQALLSGRASELSNRVNAMSAATDNAKSLINQLTLTYNKARQASITQEISEIVAGAESVK
ncbi:MAG: ATP synthase F1 subunit gamma [Candidatus Caenarcaniphilales bacterium]|nr:ATP synthase F1 subunit gamma [Candidatus Caenarcaniphilales bacterium]